MEPCSSYNSYLFESADSVFAQQFRASFDVQLDHTNPSPPRKNSLLKKHVRFSEGTLSPKPSSQTKVSGTGLLFDKIRPSKHEASVHPERFALQKTVTKTKYLVGNIFFHTFSSKPEGAYEYFEMLGIDPSNFKMQNPRIPNFTVALKKYLICEGWEQSQVDRAVFCEKIKEQWKAQIIIGGNIYAYLANSEEEAIEKISILALKVLRDSELSFRNFLMGSEFYNALEGSEKSKIDIEEAPEGSLITCVNSILKNSVYAIACEFIKSWSSKKIVQSKLKPQRFIYHYCFSKEVFLGSSQTSENHAARDALKRINDKLTCIDFKTARNLSKRFNRFDELDRAYATLRPPTPTS